MPHGRKKSSLKSSELLKLGLVSWALTACAGELGEGVGYTHTDTQAPTPTETHWSFTPLPTRVELQTRASPASGSTPAQLGIDAYVAASLETEGLEFAPRASAEKLLRRVTLDLTGLPPTLQQLDAFLADPSPAAYAAVVDRLLASPRYAEHMAAGWLDLARYSDTDGFQYDNERPSWPWRDWVIDAINSNMPFDEFTLQQLAGDLLPNATEDSHLATSFNRNHTIQGENGLLKDEFRDRYVADRVATLGKTWLGLTTGCAKCHDHKLDPLSAKDYYRLYDCFNQLDEYDNGPSSGFSPAILLKSPLSQTLDGQLEQRIQELVQTGASSVEINALQQERQVSNTGQMMRIMADKPEARETKLLALGRYDLPVGDPLRCSAPDVLPPFPADAPPNRLGLAMWLVMPEHPLTSRVTVNRFWHHHFGHGLAPTADDFGTLAERPKHLDLLNWLARWFVDNDWNVKQLQKLIVTSRTYQQASSASQTAREADPENERLARGPRQRVSAEVVRDLPLAVSGLLANRLGGPPAFPYQPPGLWEEMAWEHNQLKYPQEVGDGLYRRSIYTFWKRTLPPPFMSLFDAPDREASQAVREPGVTPQQALALLNGQQFIEAARHLATTVLEQSAGDEDEAIALGFRMVTSRTPSQEELGLLRTLFDAHEAEFEENMASRVLVQTKGQTTASALEPRNAAMTQVMRALFNLSETLTKD